MSKRSLDDDNQNGVPKRQKSDFENELELLIDEYPLENETTLENFLNSQWENITSDPANKNDYLDKDSLEQYTKSPMSQPDYELSESESEDEDENRSSRGIKRRSRARRSKARRSRARRSKARRSKARRSKARRSKARRSKARRSKARRSKARRSKARRKSSL